jgi:hypothetical protein
MLGSFIIHKSKGTKVTLFYYERLLLLHQDFYIKLELSCNESCEFNSIVSINTTTVVQIDKLVTENGHRYVDESIDNTALATFFR